MRARSQTVRSRAGTQACSGATVRSARPIRTVVGRWRDSIVSLRASRKRTDSPSEETAAKGTGAAAIAFSMTTPAASSAA